MEESQELTCLCRKALDSLTGTTEFGQLWQNVPCTLIVNPLLRNRIRTIDDFKETSVENIKRFRMIGTGKMKVIYRMRELLGCEDAPVPDTEQHHKPSNSKNIKWNYISEVGNPPKEEYDWVLVKTDFDGGECLPHIAELRNGEWHATDVDGSLEEVLDCKVVAWADMQLIK